MLLLTVPHTLLASLCGFPHPYHHIKQKLHFQVLPSLTVLCLQSLVHLREVGSWLWLLVQASTFTMAAACAWEEFPVSICTAASLFSQLALIVMVTMHLTARPLVC